MAEVHVGAVGALVLFALTVGVAFDARQFSADEWRAVSVVPAGKWYYVLSPVTLFTCGGAGLGYAIFYLVRVGRRLRRARAGDHLGRTFSQKFYAELFLGGVIPDVPELRDVAVTGSTGPSAVAVADARRAPVHGFDVPWDPDRPEQLAGAGKREETAGDPGEALVWFERAIDSLHDLYLADEMRQRRPGERDVPIIRSYLSCLERVRAWSPEDPQSDSVIEVTHRLRTISTAMRERRLDPSSYLQALEDLARIAPDVDISTVLWKNPTLRDLPGNPFGVP